MTGLNPVTLLSDLVQQPSVTPDVRGALDIVESVLKDSGFDVERPVFTETGTPDVENLFGAIGTGARHLMFAGHVDVVPPGDMELWDFLPFSAQVEDGRMFGRGTVDMKSGVAAMLVAATRFVSRRGESFDGRISFVITGDEEGRAINGTTKLLQWAADRGEVFDAAIVGEPSSREDLGDQIKVGRRGSLSATLTVNGDQGHAAYPHLADNPIRGLTTLLDVLQHRPLDQGNESFEPSTLEIVSIDVGNPAWNVIPASATARLNIRYNDLWSHESLSNELRRRLSSVEEDRRHRPRAKAAVRWQLTVEPSNSPVFLTQDQQLIDLIQRAVNSVVKRVPDLSTGGGTSDARFIKDYCPVVELGLVGKSMHQINENVDLASLAELVVIYEAVLESYFSGGAQV